MVYGASGSLGTAAVQLARHFGAHVTGVCSTRNVELVRSLGADDVVDYLEEDFTRKGETYDAIIDAVGKYSFRRGRRALRAGGSFVETDAGRFYVETLAFWVATRFVGSRRVRGAAGRRSKQDVRFMKELIEAGEFRPGGRGPPVRRDVAEAGQRRPHDGRGRRLTRRGPAWAVVPAFPPRPAQSSTRIAWSVIQRLGLPSPSSISKCASPS